MKEYGMDELGGVGGTGTARGISGEHYVKQRATKWECVCAVQERQIGGITVSHNI